MGNMMHRGKGSFTHVENTVFFDHTLSLKAKGIYCQIRSLENNPEWVFTIRGFAKLVKDGVDAVTAGLKSWRALATSSGREGEARTDVSSRPRKPHGSRSMIRQCMRALQPN